MGERGALGAGDGGGIVWNGRGRMGIIEEYEAERAEGGGVEPEDAGGTEHAVDAAEADVVEEEGPPAPPFLSLVSPPTVAALRSFFSSTSVSGWEVHLGGICSSGF